MRAPRGSSIDQRSRWSGPSASHTGEPKDKRGKRVRLSPDSLGSDFRRWSESVREIARIGQQVQLTAQHQS